MNLYLSAFPIAMSEVNILAESPQGIPIERQSASCNAWRQELNRASHTGAITGAEASAISAVGPPPADRCETTHARPMSEPPVITPDALTEAQYKPCSPNLTRSRKNIAMSA
jgi:hypothetical protein